MKPKVEEISLLNIRKLSINKRRINNNRLYLLNRACISPLTLPADENDLYRIRSLMNTDDPAGLEERKQIKSLLNCPSTADRNRREELA